VRVSTEQDHVQSTGGSSSSHVCVCVCVCVCEVQLLQVSFVFLLFINGFCVSMVCDM